MNTSLMILVLLLELLQLDFPLAVGSEQQLRSFSADWSSLDSRLVPHWYQRAKFGIFCHWGIYSVPAFGSEWFWWYWKGTKPDKRITEYVQRNYKPGISYADFAYQFSAKHFNATTFRQIIESSGAKYFVLTSKHHDGFTLWPSKTSWNWNSVDVGPHQDLVGELKNAFADSEVQFGLYFSQYEWFNQYYMDDRKQNSSNYVTYVSYPQMMELVINYQPKIVWSDGDWEMSDEYWRSKHFLAWLYNESPVKDSVVVNDRWGAGTMGKHGGFLTYADHYDPGRLLQRKWENCLSLDKSSWGYRGNMRSSDVLTVSEIITQLVRTIACNGNLLLNVGPDQNGVIPAVMEDRLHDLGAWIKRNNEAIFDSYPWMYQNDSDYIWYTVSAPPHIKMKSDTAWIPHTNSSKLYVFFLEYPSNQTVTLPSVLYNRKMKATLLGSTGITTVKATGKPDHPTVLMLQSNIQAALFKQFVICIEQFDAPFVSPYTPY